MTPLRLVTIALLVSLFSTMGGVLGTYNQIQIALSLEGNNLYSSQSVDVDEKPSTIRDALEEAGGNARVFRDLTNDGTVRAVMEFGRKSPLPLHSGRQLGSGGDRGALVGADVRVTTEKGRKSYVFEGVSYPVVGRLGLHAKSLLSRAVLLKGAGLFDGDGKARMVVDGPDVADILQGYSVTPATHDGGTDRRTNIDFVSPVLLGFGGALTVIGSVITGLLAAAYGRRLCAVRFQLGHQRTRILASSTARPLLGAAGPLLLVCGIILSLSPPVQSAGSILWNTLAPATLIVVSFVLASVRTIWRKPSWA